MCKKELHRPTGRKPRPGIRRYRTLFYIGAICPLVLSAWTSEAAAFNEPVDSAGPLTIRIEGPKQVTAVETPVTFSVQIENQSESAVEGTLRLAVIDRWRVDPKDLVSFTVPGKESVRVEFRVVAGQGTYSAHYPIHAYAEFAADGQTLVAHPILIIETQLADPPRPVPAFPWQPIELPAEGGMALGRLPVHRVVVQPFHAAPQAMPTGWLGSEPSTRAFVQFDVREQHGQTREAIAVHPPWYEGRKGTLWIEFPLRLPANLPLRLRFGQAIRNHDAARGEPPSDGVTFRVRVAPWDAPDGQAGEAVYEHHTASKQWENAEVDLSRFAGQTVRLQLECHPGPREDPTCDQAYWIEPLLLVGEAKKKTDSDELADADARRLGTLENANTRYDVVMWPGQRGLLDSTVGFVEGQETLLFEGFRVQVLGAHLEDANSPVVLRKVVDESVAGVCRWRHCFQSWAGAFDLMGELQAGDGTLRARFWLENAPPQQPWQAVYLEGVSLGPWNREALRVYAGMGNVLEKPEAFRLDFEGHRLTTSFIGLDFAAGFSLVQAVDVPPDYLQVDPKSRQYTLRTPHPQTMTLIPSTDVWSAVSRWRAVNGLRPAGGVNKLAGRFVFDLWGGRYGAIADALQRAFRYGLTDAVVVLHSWQRWGYDYRLPDIFPPNPDLGTADDFLRLANVCRERGVLFAPHDNYIDFYPDADGFSYERIAFSSDGRPIRGWLNEGRQAQAYRWRTDRVRPLLEKNVRLLRDAFAPTAYFIDVWSSIGPYDSWDADGTFRDRLSTRKDWGEAFAWIRDCLGDDAPQISESGHDQLIGWLDGATTNHLRVDVPPDGYYKWAVWPIRCGDAERIPWFDAAHHDRFALHGAGYEPRYAAGLDPTLHGIFSDDYITAEILTGHPAMVSAPFGRDVVRTYWLTHDLMRALAMQRIEQVEFAEGNIHRQHVRWTGGGEVWVNRGSDDWTVAGRTLPRYGFYGRAKLAGAIVEAAIERREGVVVDWSRSGDSLYVNARPLLAAESDPLLERMNPTGKVIDFEGIATDGALRLSMEQNALQFMPLPEGKPFTVRFGATILNRQLPRFPVVNILAEDGSTLGSLPLVREGNQVVCACQPGVFAYRVVAKAE